MVNCHQLIVPTVHLTQPSIADIGTCGFVVIIRHHGHGHTHDHLIHDCEWNEEACRCKFTRKMQAQASHQKAIRWTDTDRSFFTILFDSLQMENIVFAYSGGDLLIHVSVPIVYTIAPHQLKFVFLFFQNRISKRTWRRML